MGMDIRKIRNYLIFPKFQLTLVFFNLLVMTVSLGLIYRQITDSFAQIIDVAQRIGVPEGAAYFDVMAQHQELILSKLYIAAAIIYILCFVGTVMISHRVAGPIYRLKQHLIQTVKTGKADTLHFRKGDFYGDLPELVNQAFKEVEKGPSKHS